VSAPADKRLLRPDDRLGLSATVAIVVGGIVGTGIFTVPAAIAAYGWLSVPAFAVVGAGSLTLALTFARLVRRTRRSGGPYAYADDAFGRFAGFLAAWTYWIQGWTGHATIAVAGAGYAEALFGLGSGRVTTFAVAGAVLWVAALNNLVGTRSVGAVAVGTTVLKITALVIVAVAGLLAFHAGRVGPVRAHGGSWTALPSASALLLFSFLGMESAAVATNRLRDPTTTCRERSSPAWRSWQCSTWRPRSRSRARCRRPGSPNQAPHSPTPRRRSSAAHGRQRRSLRWH
jgi:APA family basic amino acid/polyamine antiporter